jgi:hypothetical protein
MNRRRKHTARITTLSFSGHVGTDEESYLSGTLPRELLSAGGNRARQISLPTGQLGFSRAVPTAARLFSEIKHAAK